jgi:hypothetical protein
MLAEHEAESFDERAADLKERVNHERGASVCRVERPFARAFPLRGSLGRGLYAGRLPDAELGFAVARGSGILDLAHFNADGQYLRDERRSLTELFADGEWSPRREETIEAYLVDEFGMQLDLVHLREFRFVEDVAVYLWPGHLEDILISLDEEPFWDSDERLEVGEKIHYWLAAGDFVVEAGNDYWAGPDGRIHSS